MNDQSEQLTASIAREDPRRGTTVLGEDTRGDKKYQTVLAAYDVGGATIKEVLDVVYYYVPKSVRYGVIAHESGDGVVIGNEWPGEFELQLSGDTVHERPTSTADPAE